jgi:acid phosphatase family membrane protein YuiD
MLTNDLIIDDGDTKDYMEFTKILKYSSSVLFLVLLVHGLVLGFSIPTTILAVVLAAVVCLFEAQLVKSERLEQMEQLNNIVKEFNDHVNTLSKTQTEDKKELIERIANTDSKISSIKLSNGIKRL